MAITTRTIVDQIEVTDALSVQVRLARVLEEAAEDGQAVEIHREYHRMSVAFGPKPMKRLDEMIAAVAAHLPSMGWPEIDADGLDRVRRVARAAWRGPKAIRAHAEHALPRVRDLREQVHDDHQAGHEDDEPACDEQEHIPAHDDSVPLMQQGREHGDATPTV